MSDGDSQPDRKPPADSRLARLLRVVGSVRVAVALIVLLGFYCVPGVFPQVYRDWLGISQREYYGHVLLWLLCGAFCVSLLACTLDRVLFRRRGSVGMALTHVSILLLAGGAGWFALGSFDGDVQLYLGQRKDCFYTDRPALHVRWPGAEGLEVYPLEGIRTTRAGLPCGPQQIRQAEGGPSLEVIDYLPAARLEASTGEHAAAPVDPMIRCRLGGRDFTPTTAWLRRSAAGGDRLAGNGWSLSFRWAAHEAELNALSRPRPNSRLIHVRLPEAKYEALLSGTVGSSLWLERFGYLLTVERIEPMTDRGEDATPACVLRIDSPHRSFRRYLLARYPQWTEDEPLGAVSRPATGPATLRGVLDAELVTEYSAGVEQLWVTAGPGIAPRVIHHRQDGSVAEMPLKTGEPRTLRILGRQMDVTVEKVIQRPLTRLAPSPLGVRPDPDPARTVSVLRVRSADGQFEQCVPFSAYADEAEPLRMPVPREEGEEGLAEVIFGRVPRPLGFTVALTDFRVETYPGGEVPKDYASRLRLDDGRGAAREATVRLNAPVDFGGLSLYQSSYDGYRDLAGRMPRSGRPWTYTVLSVSHKPGLPLIYLGFAGLGVGVLVSFYVQPLVRRLRHKAAGEGEGEPR